MSRIQDAISVLLGRADNHVLTYKRGGWLPNLELTKHKFGETIYLNIVELLTSIYAELTWSGDATSAKFRAWKMWADRNGQRILTQLLFARDGFCVVGYDHDETNDTWRFYELPRDAWRVDSTGDVVKIVCTSPAQRFYVLKSPAMEAVGMSEAMLCDGFVKMIDAVMNGATTTAERLGAYVVMSPKQDNFGGVMLKGDKDDFEKELQKEYGMLSKQKQIMVLPRPMDSQVVSLAAVDTKMSEKLRAAVLGIADRIKVPANQIALIDANSSKPLSNGTELREGDMSKYRSFRRLVDSTFYDMAKELGLRVDYTLENEPKSVQGQQIEQ